MILTSKRLYFVLLSLIGLLLVGLIVGTLQINSLLGRKASNLTTVKAKSLALEKEKSSLKKAKEDLKKYEDLYAITQAIVPNDKNQAQAVREIVKIADKNNVKLSSITFPASTLGASAAKATASSDTETKKPAAPASSASGSLSQLQAVKEITGVYSLTITIVSDTTKPVPYNQFVSFLEDLESNRRTAQVNTVTIEPKKENRGVLSFTLTLNEYIKP
jgi:Tfp pilus assembly protein PilO